MKLPVRALLAISLLLALSLAGCERNGTPRAPEWSSRWGSLSHAGPRWRTGVEFVVVTHEGRPDGVRDTREHWVLLERDSVNGVFERRREGARATVVSMRLHPAGPIVPMAAGRSRRGRYSPGGALEAVGVPAGRFRCGRTVRTVQERDGRMMRVDEWWSPGVPVAVQSWKRWVGVIDTLRDPPRRVRDVRTGTTWAVLETVRRP